MDHELVLAVLRLLTRLFEASKALPELLRQHRKDSDNSEEAPLRPRHLKE